MAAECASVDVESVDPKEDESSDRSGQYSAYDRAEN
jgi:hypothetical protein